MIAVSRFTLVAMLSLLFWMPALSSEGWARPKRYSKAQVKRALQQARRAHVAKTLQNHPRLRTLHAREAALEHRMRRGFCKTASYPWVGKRCSEHCVFWLPTFRRHCHKVIFKTVCVKLPSGHRCAKRARICYPVKRTRRVQLCVREERGAPVVTVNGRRTGVSGVIRLVEHDLHALQRDFHKAQQDMKKVSRSIATTARSVAHTASHVFDAVAAEVKKKAKQLAHKLAPLFKNRIAKKMGGLLASKTAKASQLFWKKSKKPLLKALEMDDYDEARSLMEKNRSSAKMMRDFSETVLISMGVMLSVDALLVTLKCWPYAKETKRACLKDAVAVDVRDSIFNTAGILVQTALDVGVIAPTSEDLAMEVAAGLASVTEGVGAIAYPIAYEASSIAMNLLTVLLWEQLRKPYNRLYAKTLAHKNRLWIDKMVNGLPASLMRCPGPHVLCKAHYQPKKTTRLR